MKRVAAQILLLCMLLTAVPAAAVSEFLGHMEVVNCREWVSLRESPSIKAQRLAKVPLGAVVRECQQWGDDWNYAQYEDDEGYIQAKYLQQCEGVSVHSAMLVTDCGDGTDFYLSAGGLEPDGFIRANTIVRDCAVYEYGRAYVKYGDQSVYIRAEHVVPYAELQHFPHKIAVMHNLYNGLYEGPASSLKATAAEKFPLAEYAYSEYAYEAEGEELPWVNFVLHADKTVNHVHLFSAEVMSMDEETGEAEIELTLEGSNSCGSSFSVDAVFCNLCVCSKATIAHNNFCFALIANTHKFVAFFAAHCATVCQNFNVV